MYKKNYFQKRLNLLLISLEALDIYALETIQIGINNYYIDNTFFIKNKNYIRNFTNNYYIEFNELIKFIYYFYSLIIKSYSQQTTSQILNNYANKNQSEAALQYINRYQYIYNKTQKYHNTKNYKNNLNTEKLAITNLYIIHKIHNKYGIYFLIKYLINNKIK